MAGSMLETPGAAVTASFHKADCSSASLKILFDMCVQTRSAISMPPKRIVFPELRVDSLRRAVESGGDGKVRVVFSLKERLELNARINSACVQTALVLLLHGSCAGVCDRAPSPWLHVPGDLKERNAVSGRRTTAHN